MMDLNSKNHKENLVVVGMILVAALTRLIPHLPNLTSVVAIGLFAGAYLSNRWLAILIPVASMLISDFILGFHGGMMWVYLPLVMIAAGSTIWLSTQSRWNRIFYAGFLSSLIFYIVSNFGVWLEGTLYPQTLNGLIDFYVMAIPFFGNQVLGDLFYLGLLFGGYALVKLMMKKLLTRPFSL